MAFALTYNTLVTNIMNYLERSDAPTQATIPMFVVLAQDRINKDCKTLGLEAYVTTQMTLGNTTLSKPIDWRNTITFNYLSPTTNTYQPLLIRTYEFCRLYWPDPTQTAPPLYVSDYGYGQWMIVPTPDQNYACEIAYMQYLPSIDANNQTNWLTQFAPEVLFYACMVEAMIYLKDDERIQFWKTMYDEALNSLKVENRDRYQDRYSDRTKD